MPSQFARQRRAAFDEQDRRCYYCSRRMWWSSPGEIGPGAKTDLQCTAEHLHARRDGGPNSTTNIVAACRSCNAGRHAMSPPLDPAEYKAHVLRGQ